jgi:hypothetical protein
MLDISLAWQPIVTDFSAYTVSKLHMALKEKLSAFAMHRNQWRNAFMHS